MLRLPKSVRTLSAQTFRYCDNLKTVDISLGNERLTIGDEAFADCQNLETVKILGKDVFLSNKVFANFPNLKSVTFSKSTLFKDNAFENCNKDLEIKMVDL